MSESSNTPLLVFEDSNNFVGHAPRAVIRNLLSAFAEGESGRKRPVSESRDLGGRERKSGLSVGVLACWRAGVGMLGKSRLAPARVLGRRRSKTRWARAAGGQGLVSRPVPPADRAARTGAHHLLHCSCPPLAGICLLALVLAHLPPCPRPRVPLHSSIPQSSVADGLRGSTLVEASASIWKHLEASGSIWKRAASSLARAHSSAHSSLAGL